MYVEKDYQKLTADVAPDSLVLLIVDMISPKKPGEYATIWGLVEARTGLTLCTFTAKITVK
jgi:hypothetical protein